MLQALKVQKNEIRTCFIKIDILGEMNVSKTFEAELSNSSEGRLISKCPFGFIVSTKRAMEKFDEFCPRMGRENLSNLFVGILVQMMAPKGHFEIN